MENISDECKREGTLASLFEFLKKVHWKFVEYRSDSSYHDDSLFDYADYSVENTVDVRDILKILRKQILNGCKIAFSSVWERRVRGQDHPLWLLAQELGATCVENPDESITHLVTLNPGTEIFIWAKKHKKFVVHPKWIETASFIWRSVL